MDNGFQLNFFDSFEEKSEEQTYLEKDLKRGSSFERGKCRIAFAYLHKNLSKTDFVEFVKNEYGLGGYGCSDYDQHHNEKGITIKVNQREGEPVKYYFSWSKIANEIIALIQKGEYFNAEQEKDFNMYVAVRIGTKESRIKAMAKYCYETAKSLFKRMGNFYQGFQFGISDGTQGFYSENIEAIKKEVENIGKDIKEVVIYKEFKNFNIRILF